MQQRLVLFAGSNMEEVQSIPLRRQEQVLCCTELQLPTEPGGSPDSVLAIGTGLMTPRAMEEPPWGRLLLFKVSFSGPIAPQSQVKNVLQPVTAQSL